MVHENVVQFEYQSILPVHKLTLKPSILLMLMKRLNGECYGELPKKEMA